MGGRGLFMSGKGGGCEWEGEDCVSGCMRL